MSVFNLADSIVDLDDLTKFPAHFFYDLLFSDKKKFVFSSLTLLNMYFSNHDSFDLVSQGYFLDSVLDKVEKNVAYKRTIPARFGLFVNSDLFCVGFNDNSNYFKNLDVKNLWERDYKHKELVELSKSLDRRDNFFYFKSRFDRVFIDNKVGTFYGVVNVNGSS